MAVLTSDKRDWKIKTVTVDKEAQFVSTFLIPPVKGLMQQEDMIIINTHA